MGSWERGKFVQQIVELIVLIDLSTVWDRQNQSNFDSLIAGTRIPSGEAVYSKVLKCVKIKWEVSIIVLCNGVSFPKFFSSGEGSNGNVHLNSSGQKRISTKERNLSVNR